MQNFTGYEYIKIDIANHFGLDKELFEPRIKWVDKNHKKLESLMDKADEPFLYMAGVLALREAEAHKPTGHMIGFDACASGMQILAVLSGCPLTAALTGLINPNERADAYSKIVVAMNKLLPKELQIGLNVDGLTRADVKLAVMTYFYGSEQEPKNAFKEGSLAYQVFFQVLHELAPGAEQLRNLFIGIWPKGATENSWHLPDGLNARVRVMVDKETKIEVDELGGATFTHYYAVNEGTDKGVALAAHITHSIDGYLVREIGRRCDYAFMGAELVEALALLNKYLDGRVYQAPDKKYPVSLAAVHSLNSKTIGNFPLGNLFALKALINKTMTRSESFEVISVHDEFKCPPNNMGTLREVYLEIMQEIADSDLAQTILREITGRPNAVYKKFTNDLSSQMMNSNYHIC